MKATTNTIDASTIAEPRSLWTRHRPAPTMATSITGTSVRCGLPISSLRLASRLAQYSSTDSFKNSDGCNESGPIAIQALASLTRSPTPGMNGSSIIPHEHDQHGQNQTSPEVIRHAHPDPQTDQAEAGPHHLLVEDAKWRLALVELVDRRGRQHHHQTEHHEDGDDHGDRVERGGRRRGGLRRHAPAGVPAQCRGPVERLPAAIADHGRRRAHRAPLPK